MVETVLCVYASRLAQGQSRLGLEVCPAQPSLLELTSEHTVQP